MSLLLTFSCIVKCFYHFLQLKCLKSLRIYIRNVKKTISIWKMNAIAICWTSAFLVSILVLNLVSHAYKTFFLRHRQKHKISWTIFQCQAFPAGPYLCGQGPEPSLKACQGKTLYIIVPNCKFGRKWRLWKRPLNYKILQIRNLRQMDRFFSKLVSFLSSAANTLAWKNTLAYFRIRKLRTHNVL